MKMLIDLSLGEVYGPSVMGEASPAGGVAWVNHGKPIINQTVRKSLEFMGLWPLEVYSLSLFNTIE